MNQTGGLIRTNDANLACFELAGRLLRDRLADVRGFYDGGMLFRPSALPVMLGHEQMADFVYASATALMSWLDDSAQVVNVELPRLHGGFRLQHLPPPWQENDSAAGSDGRVRPALPSQSPRQPAG